MLPPRTDPEVAALAFGGDLDALWARGRPRERGWQRQRLDELTEIIVLPGRRDGVGEPYFIRLRGYWYPDLPPQVTFVSPEDFEEAAPGSTWLPVFSGAPFNFSLHPIYDFPTGDGTPAECRQLVCFSQSFDYYVSNHTPQPSERWTPGVHKVAATLNRLHEVLGPPWYQGPSSPRLAEAA